MSHEGDRIQIDGTVTALHRNRIDVTLSNGSTIRAVLAGRLLQRHIKVVPGDAVVVQISAYDPNIGRIVYRHK
jgi:translation initiation factor IF-1